MKVCNPDSPHRPYLFQHRDRLNKVTVELSAAILIIIFFIYKGNYLNNVPISSTLSPKIICCMIASVTYRLVTAGSSFRSDLCLFNMRNIEFILVGIFLGLDELSPILGLVDLFFGFRMRDNLFQSIVKDAPLAHSTAKNLDEHTRKNWWVHVVKARSYLADNSRQYA